MSRLSLAARPTASLVHLTLFSFAFFTGLDRKDGLKGQLGPAKFGPERKFGEKQFKKAEEGNPRSLGVSGSAKLTAQVCGGTEF